MFKKIIATVICMTVIFTCGCDNEAVENVESNVLPNISSSSSTKADSYRVPYNAAQSLNPIITQSRSNLYLCGLIFEGLVTLDNSLSASNNIAESVDMSENNTVCTVKLKKGMLFSDGSEISSLDVVATVQAIKSQMSSYYYSWFKNVASVVSAEAYEVIFTLSAPDPKFENLLAFPIVKNGSLHSTDFIGSGRYYIRHDANAVLSANENWYGGEVEMKEIVLVDLADTDSIRHELDKGTIDFMYTEGSIDTLGTVAMKTVTVNNAVMLAYNTKRPYFASGEHRRAFDLLQDKALLADNDVAAVASNVPFNPNFYNDETKITSALTIEKIANENGFTEKDEDGYYFISDRGKTTYFTLKLIYLEKDIKRKSQIKLIKKAYEASGIKIETKAYFSDDEFSADILSGEYDLCYFEMRFNNNSDLMPLFTGSLSSLFFKTGITEAYNKYIMGEISVSDFSKVYISNMPISLLYYRNGRAMYSRNFGADIEVFPEFIFANAEKWILYN